jgi:sarcosine oxidase subunit gamma
MAEAIAMPQSSLEGILAVGRHGRYAGTAGVEVQEVVGLEIAAVIARRTAVTTLPGRAEQEFGIALPATPGRSVNGNLAFVSTGPGRWLAIRPMEPPVDLAARLKSHLGDDASIIDQGHAYSVLRLSGHRVRDALAKGVTVDLHPRAFRTGHVASTVVSHIAVHLWQIADDPIYELATTRSSAASLWHWLEASAAEYGIDVIAPDAGRELAGRI